jgi:type IV secretory pathway TrbL component
MGGTGVIDRFLEVFTRYIDSGFGLLNGEVATTGHFLHHMKRSAK